MTLLPRAAAAPIPPSVTLRTPPRPPVTWINVPTGMPITGPRPSFMEMGVPAAGWHPDTRSAVTVIDGPAVMRRTGARSSVSRRQGARDLPAYDQAGTGGGTAWGEGGAR